MKHKKSIMKDWSFLADLLPEKWQEVTIDGNRGIITEVEVRDPIANKLKKVFLDAKDVNNIMFNFAAQSPIIVVSNKNLYASMSSTVLKIFVDAIIDRHQINRMYYDTWYRKNIM